MGLSDEGAARWPYQDDETAPVMKPWNGMQLTVKDVLTVNPSNKDPCNVATPACPLHVLRSFLIQIRNEATPVIS